MYLRRTRSFTSRFRDSKGNDKVDKLANDFRLLSASDAPQKYLTSTEEIFILAHDEKVIQSDPRTYMKNLESELLSKDWKRKAPRQVEWFQKHPTKILKQSKLVLQWATKKGDGRGGSTLFWESVNGYRLDTACTAISTIAPNPSAVSVFRIPKKRAYSCPCKRTVRTQENRFGEITRTSIPV